VLERVSARFSGVGGGGEGERPPLTCACGFSTRYPGTLAQHARERHAGERPFACGAEGCGYAAQTSQRLARHRARSHGAHGAPAPGEQRRSALERAAAQARASACAGDGGGAGGGASAGGGAGNGSSGSSVARSVLAWAVERASGPHLTACGARGCTYTAGTRAALEGHARVEHAACGVPQCRFPAVLRWAFDAHAREHAGAAQPFSCEAPGCGYCAAARSAVVAHARRHPAR
jgi:hypothetical protein